MLTATTSLPFSLVRLMIDDMSVVNDLYSYRPDKLVADNSGADAYLEALCNEASNTSPISMDPGTKYLLPSRQFQKYFLMV